MTIDELREILRTRTAGYLRNTDRSPGATCRVCTTPLSQLSGRDICGACAVHVQSYGRLLADLVVPIVYGGHNVQSRRLLYGYKDPTAGQPGDERPTLVQGLLVAATFRHSACIERTVGVPVDLVATVPSTKGRLNHPLSGLTQACMPGIARTSVMVTSTGFGPRDVSPDRFQVPPALVPAKHAVIFDDTWVTGARTQSLALTLRRNGVERITILALARWLDPGWEATRMYLSAQTEEGFDPYICPVTGWTCP